jgi:hypothetical protein
MDKPGINTAIPKRRYRLGEFSLVVLGEIDSADGIDYGYILAAVREGEAEPGLYITAQSDPQQPTQNSLSMRVIMRDGSEVIGMSNRWGDLELFTSDALDIVVKILDLADEQPFRLL